MGRGSSRCLLPIYCVREEGKSLLPSIFPWRAGAQFLCKTSRLLYAYQDFKSCFNSFWMIQMIIHEHPWTDTVSCQQVTPLAWKVPEKWVGQVLMIRIDVNLWLFLWIWFSSNLKRDLPAWGLSALWRLAIPGLIAAAGQGQIKQPLQDIGFILR